MSFGTWFFGRFKTATAVVATTGVASGCRRAYIGAQAPSAGPHRCESAPVRRVPRRRPRQPLRVARTLAARQVESMTDEHRGGHLLYMQGGLTKGLWVRTLAWGLA